MAVVVTDCATNGTPNDRSNNNDGTYQHVDPPFGLTVPRDGIRRVQFFVRGGSSFESGMSVDGWLSSRVHRRVTGIARQQVDIVTFLQADRPVESRLRTRAGDRPRTGEKRKTDLFFGFCGFRCSVEKSLIVISAWWIGGHGLRATAEPGELGTKMLAELVADE